MPDSDGVFDIGDEITLEMRFSRRDTAAPVNPAAPIAHALKPDRETLVALAPQPVVGESGVFTAKFRVDQEGDWELRGADGPENSSTVVTGAVISVRKRRVPAPA